MTELTENIHEWARERGILDGNVSTQCYKLVSELGELADAIIKKDVESIIDAIGDCYVVLVSITHFVLVEEFNEGRLGWYTMLLELTSKLTALEGSKVKDHLKDDLASISRLVEIAYILSSQKHSTYTKADAVDRIIYELYVLCDRHELSLRDCVASAYSVIKDRKGKTLPNGNFVKDAE